ncbi:MAG: hypothetical protein Q9208_002776 [Pyrenodesmia sp. 3 TL-2023]
MAGLNYFVCTLGQALEVNSSSPHPYGTINDLLDYQAEFIPDRLAVGFPAESLVHDDVHATLAQSASNLSDATLNIFAIPKTPPPESQSREQPGQENALQFTSRPQSTFDVAFYFHTSGTSSGLPKPIPQTHHGAVGVLPRLPNGHQKATFTTTPLYHGGIADCFRAWTSGALIWLFPGNDVPITTSNTLKCLNCAQRAETWQHAPPVKYFSSVPYILQMVSAESKGMMMLQGMDIVGVGGAALPPDFGDSLVENGVNLVSRFGSAECGFLLSSDREYEKDKGWQFLRNHVPDLLRFEPQQNGTELSELVIQPHWPHMAKRNREDGSFATADLFAPHPSTKNAWKYHSRADSQLTLITGKKFDPAPLEAAIALSDLVRDALIVGNGKQCPGALLFRSDNAKDMDAGRLLDELWPLINRLNGEGQPHTRLSRSMLVVMDPEAPRLEKSSKGTVLRAQAQERYAREIQSAYDKGNDNIELEEPVNIPDDEIPAAVVRIIKDVIGTPERIPEDADLFSFGIDSVACMAIRAKLQARILRPGSPQLPLNVVYDCGNIKRLSKYLLDIRQGRMTNVEDEIQLMNDLVDRYSDFSRRPNCSDAPNGGRSRNTPELTSQRQVHGEHVLLTGATGALGAHILHLLRSSSTTSKISCLVRAASDLAAHERVSKSLAARGKPGLPPFLASFSPSTTSQIPKITCLPTTLSHPSLGLDAQTYTTLATTTTLVIHAAWAVNFTARLRSFERDHIAGLSHLLSFSLACSSSSSSSPSATTTNPNPPRILFLSSTASTTSSPHSPIPETPSPSPTDASPLGYSRSKWVAERICSNFHSQTQSPTFPFPSPSTSTPPRIAILRIGQLTSDTATGIWNMSEAWPLMLSTAPALGALPDLGALPLDWLPVDRAAEAVLEVAGSLTTDENHKHKEEKGEIPVFHILNPHRTPTWTHLLHAIRAASPALCIEILPPRKWLAKLEAYEGDHLAAKKLVGLWREGFAGDDDGRGKGGPVFEVQRAKEASAVMRDLKPLDEAMLGRMWGWVEGQVGGKGKE